MKVALVTTSLILSTVFLFTGGVNGSLSKGASKKPIPDELSRITEPNKPQTGPNVPDNLIGEVNIPTDKRADYDRELSELKNNPKEYAEMRTMSTFMAELVLAESGYDPGPFDGALDKRTQAALRAYQKNRGIPVTGDPLSYETFTQLNKGKEILDQQLVSLSPLFVFTDMWDNGYVSASGTWTISGEKTVWTEQTSDIQYFRDMDKCIEATAIVMRNEGEPHLFVALEIYEIERWDAHEIVTNPKETAGGCVRYVTKFNRLNKSVTGTRSTISDEGPCKAMERGEKYLVLVDGLEITKSIKEDLEKKRRELIQISPSLLKTLESGAEKKTK